MDERECCCTYAQNNNCQPQSLNNGVSNIIILINVRRWVIEEQYRRNLALIPEQ